MKKSDAKNKLTLRRESIRQLKMSERELREIVGGDGAIIRPHNTPTTDPFN